MLISFLTMSFILSNLHICSSQESTVNNECAVGCKTCSLWNGCIQCEENYVWHIEQVYMRRVGVCLSSCPEGHMTLKDDHVKELRRCMACEADHCLSCNSTYKFCENCKSPYLEYRGHCILECPDQMTHSKYRKDCFEHVDCLVSSWSGWSVCTRNNQTCGYKWGNQTRTRRVVESPSQQGQGCPTLTEFKRCRLEERYCANNQQPNQEKNPDREKTRQEKRKARRRCRVRKLMGQPCQRSEVEETNQISAPVKPLNITATDSRYYDYYREKSIELLLLIQQERKNREKKTSSR